MKIERMAVNDETGDTPAIYVDALSKQFGTGENAVTAVDDVSFEIDAGTVVGLLGPNGAGKTTAIKSLLGLIVPDTGTVEIAGIDVSDRPSAAYQNIGVILEGARNIYWRLTVRENLAFFAGLGGDDPRELQERHEALLIQFDLTSHADTTVNELSRGMKQKVSLATTLARDVEVIFLDEPTLGLDIETALEFREELSKLADQHNVTIVLCSHDMDVIEAVCDEVIIMNDGRIVTHETVPNLLELFQSHRYEITLNEPEPKVCQRAEQSANITYTYSGNYLTVTISSTDGTELSDMITVILNSGSEIQRIRTLEPDLEEVFLRVVESSENSTHTDSQERQSQLKSESIPTPGNSQTIGVHASDN